MPTKYVIVKEVRAMSDSALRELEAEIEKSEKYVLPVTMPRKIIRASVRFSWMP